MTTLPALVALVAVALPRTGSVVFATAKTLYLDRGASRGLSAGVTLQLRRAGRTSGSCRVEQVSKSHSSCAGAGAVGDVFDVPAVAPGQPSPPPPRPPPPASKDLLAAEQRALDAAGFEKVDFAAPPSMTGGARRAEVRLSHATWASSDVGPWHQERLDARITGAPVFGGFSLYADLSARRYTSRSDPVSARPDDPTQLYVWEAALSRRPGPGAIALSVGRVRPWSTPGSTIIDGAQAGWVSKGGRVEAGLFGGVVPDLITLAPSTSRGTAGAYLRFEQGGEAGTAVQLAREEARLAYVSNPELGQRAEAELLGQLWLVHDVSVSANARLAVGDRSSPRGLDAIRLDLGARPASTLSLSAGFRYQGLSVPERDGPGAVGYGGASRHADLSAAWQPKDWIAVSALSGVATDLVTSVTRGYIGPELALPRLFGSSGGVSFGYATEGGWSSGSDAWMQMSAHTHALQFLGRLSWFRTRGLAAVTDDELGGYAHVSAKLGSQFTFQLAALARIAGLAGSSPFSSSRGMGEWLELSLAGVF